MNLSAGQRKTLMIVLGVLALIALVNIIVFGVGIGTGDSSFDLDPITTNP